MMFRGSARKASMLPVEVIPSRYRDRPRDQRFSAAQKQAEDHGQSWSARPPSSSARPAPRSSTGAPISQAEPSTAGRPPMIGTTEPSSPPASPVSVRYPGSSADWEVSGSPARGRAGSSPGGVDPVGSFSVMVAISLAEYIHGPAHKRGSAEGGNSSSGGCRGECVVDPGPQGRQGYGAGLPGRYLSAAQHQQGGDGLGGEPLGDLRRDVDVHFDQLHLACQVTGQLLKRRADHPAGAAPGRPQIDDDGNLGRPRDLIEGGVVGIGDPRQRLMALAAAGRPGRSGRHPVRLVTVLASH